MRPIAAILAIPLGLWLIVAGWTAFELAPPQPIPPPRAAVATPVASFPHTPPIRATAAAFISIRKQPVVAPNHKQILMHWYLPEPEMGMGMH